MQVGQDKAFPMQFAFVAEVEQVADRLAGDAHVIEESGFVIRSQLGDGFQFNNDPFANEQVGPVDGVDLMLLVDQAKFVLGSKRNAAQLQLDLEALLLDLLRHAVAKLVVNLKRGSHELAAFFFEHALISRKETEKVGTLFDANLR